MLRDGGTATHRDYGRGGRNVERADSATTRSAGVDERTDIACFDPDHRSAHRPYCSGMPEQYGRCALRWSGSKQAMSVRSSTPAERVVALSARSTFRPPRP